MTHIKICGIRDADLAQQTIKAGADFIGLVFHPNSKRFVTLDQAKLIANTVKKAGGTPVAVFVNQSAIEMQTICEATNIQSVQLHGVIARSQHHLLPAHYQRFYVKSIGTQKEDNINNDDGLALCDPKRDFILFDGAEAGSGKTFDWDRFSKTDLFRKKFPWFLSGGLNANNIPIALRKLSPTGIDVSSGVESNPGEKDLTLIEKFISAVKLAKNGDQNE